MHDIAERSVQHYLFVNVILIKLRIGDKQETIYNLRDHKGKPGKPAQRCSGKTDYIWTNCTIHELWFILVYELSFIFKKSELFICL